MKTYYVDMDGVLADFENYIHTHNIPYAPQSNRKPDDDKKMWDAIKKIPHFYDKLEPIPGSLEAFRELSKENHCEILSAIPKPKWGLEHTESDKRNWIKRHLGEDIKVNIVYREEKVNFCKGKDSILIDDLPKNIKEWEAAGGTGILFTNPEDMNIKSKTPVFDKIKKMRDQNVSDDTYKEVEEYVAT